MAGVALVVGGGSAVYDLVGSQGLLREQLVKRGRYIASNLAYNSKYGVLTEDKPLLTQFLEGALSAESGGRQSDVVGAMIRDAKGADPGPDGHGHQGPAGRCPPPTLEERDAVTTDGRARDPLPRPRHHRRLGGGDMAAELGLAAPAEAKPAEAQKGGVEVAISQIAMRSAAAAALPGRRPSSALCLVALGALGGWYLDRPLVPARSSTWSRSPRRWPRATSRRASPIESDDEIGTLAKAASTRWWPTCAASWTTSRRPRSRWPPPPARSRPTRRLITQGAQGQAQAAEETSTSMEEMAASIQTVAGNAQSLANYVEETSSLDHGDGGLDRGGGPLQRRPSPAP